MIKIYGIKNCDKCRKAMHWFDKQQADYQFHDVRSDGLTDALLRNWQKRIEAGTLLNRRSQTWRQIPEAERDNLSAAGERKLALDYPTVVKRPVVTDGNSIYIGYDETAWKTLI
jgi:Spx/MgsR family transcriptional regulator